jgi:hypothetical protein
MADIANVFHNSALPIIISQVEEALALEINVELPP